MPGTSQEDCRMLSPARFHRRDRLPRRPTAGCTCVIYNEGEPCQLGFAPGISRGILHQAAGLQLPWNARAQSRRILISGNFAIRHSRESGSSECERSWALDSRFRGNDEIDFAVVLSSACRVILLFQSWREPTRPPPLSGMRAPLADERDPQHARNEILCSGYFSEAK